MIGTLNSEEIEEEDIKIKYTTFTNMKEKKVHKLSRFSPSQDEVEKKEEEDGSRFKISSRVMTEEEEIREQENIEIGQ